MPKIREVIRWENYLGEPIQVNGVIVTPESQSFVVRVPFFHISWNRPVAVHVNDGQTETRFSILDITRITQLGVVAAGLISAGLLWVMGRKH